VHFLTSFHFHPYAPYLSYTEQEKKWGVLNFGYCI